MVMEGFSADALYEFMDYAANKGLIKSATARSRKLASQRILSVLDQSQLNDLRKVDFESAFHRFQNLEGGKFTPGSLGVYKSRMKAAVEDFFSWRENPSGFKPGSLSRKSRANSDKKNQGKTVKQKTLLIDKPADDYTSDGVVFPIPLRGDCIVRISGLPSNLTQAEAEKIAAVVKALANLK